MSRGHLVCTSQRLSNSTCVCVCTYLGNGNEEVESEAENGSGQQHNEHNKGSILKVSQLYLLEGRRRVGGRQGGKEGRREGEDRHSWHGLTEH